MFQLYREQSRIFEFDDYGALLGECQRVGARNILEFGPGISTLALIESGAERVVTCEYQDRWLASAQELLKGHPQVSVHRYHNEIDVRVSGLASGKEFDFAFVDSPLGSPSRNVIRHPGQEECNRLNTALFALDRSPVVVMHDAKREGEGYTLARLAALGHRITLIDTRRGLARIERAAAAQKHTEVIG
jgi:hypothetical protein